MICFVFDICYNVSNSWRQKLGKYLRTVGLLFYDYYPLICRNKQVISMEWLSAVGSRLSVRDI